MPTTDFIEYIKARDKLLQERGELFVQMGRTIHDYENRLTSLRGRVVALEKKMKELTKSLGKQKAPK